MKKSPSHTQIKEEEKSTEVEAKPSLINLKIIFSKAYLVQKLPYNRGVDLSRSFS